MEREIKIVVKVSDEKHAEAIRNDIISAVKMRTPEFYIGLQSQPSKSIEDSYLEDDYFNNLSMEQKLNKYGITKKR